MEAEAPISFVRDTVVLVVIQVEEMVAVLAVAVIAATEGVRLLVGMVIVSTVLRQQEVMVAMAMEQEVVEVILEAEEQCQVEVEVDLAIVLFQVQLT